MAAVGGIRLAAGCKLQQRGNGLRGLTTLIKTISYGFIPRMKMTTNEPALTKEKKHKNALTSYCF